MWNGYAWASQGIPSTSVPNIVVFTASGVYTPSPNLLRAIVEVVGGGGGGSGLAATANAVTGCGGGGSGGYSKKTLTAAQIGVSQTITIGAGGAGAVAAATANSGGDTSFGALCIAKGGSGNSGLSAGLGGPVTGAVGDVISAGAPGIHGSQITLGQGNSAAGDGGSSVYGGGGIGAPLGANGTSGNGNPASNYGSGGGGGMCTNGPACNGGNGSAGVCIITEFR